MDHGLGGALWEGRHCVVVRRRAVHGRFDVVVRPIRPVSSFWSLSVVERSEFLEALDRARAWVRARCGTDDCEIRWSDRADGNGPFEVAVDALGGALPAEGPPHARNLVRGEDDGLLAHLKAYFPAARRVDIAVAFVMDRGVERLLPFLEDLLARDGQLRLLTGDYFGVTEPDGLERLLDLEGSRELRVFESGGSSFHPKAYLFHEAADAAASGVAFVGSSNLSAKALGDGVEWNYRVVGQRDLAGFRAVVEGFEALFLHPRTRELDHDWITEYRQRRRSNAGTLVGVAPEWEPPPQPNPVQREALRALEEARQNGSRAGLVVLATGLGKTWLSAFDSRGFERVLFVAHREEILQQARATYRRIRPEAALGMFTGKEQDPAADVLFASVQTLGRLPRLRDLDARRFDYIVVDEFHHAAAQTYRNIIERFEPRFLLGLTATPERTDAADLMGLCGDHLVFRCDLGEGVRRGLLCPFHYRGVPDDVDYAQIPWRSNRFDEEALTQAWATQRRAQNAFEQLQEHGGERVLAFCVSQRHADFMAEFLRDRGVAAVAVHAGPTSAPRAHSLERLRNGSLRVVCSVDMFNEGVDVPAVDTVLMLRPTQSRILWLQQFGRGLRVATGKSHLRVIDYIGNHRSFLDKPRVLLGALIDVGGGLTGLRTALRRVIDGKAELPPGCEVVYETETIEILERLIAPSPRVADLVDSYEDLRLRHGRRPTAAELLRSGADVRRGLGSDGSWFDFVAERGDLSREMHRVLGRHRAFLSELQRTPMQRSHEMMVLSAMLELGRLPGEVAVGELAERFERAVGRVELLRSEWQASVSAGRSAEAVLKSEPLRAWAGTERAAEPEWFALSGDRFGTRFDVAGEDVAVFEELARELIDWRLAEYVSGLGADRRVVLDVVGEPGGWVLRPLRVGSLRGMTSPGVSFEVEGEVYAGQVGEIGLTRLWRPEGDGANELPDVLERWFTSDHGVLESGARVAMEGGGHRFRLTPEVRVRPSAEATRAGLVVGHSYPREKIPPSFGEEFNQGKWHSGVVSVEGAVVLLVTLDKSGKAAEHRYVDGFETPTRFVWESQRKSRRDQPAGERLRDHRARGLAVHLFVRRGKLRGRTAAPFTYCGEVDFADWEGDAPITVRWDLRVPLSEVLWRRFGPR
ncbi:MAG: DUF3427 domain-containing protein [Planctomycetes bacterium]|nr:DUF3427 domain-containing protein [Planctomycetota bacterium]